MKRAPRPDETCSVIDPLPMHVSSESSEVSSKFSGFRDAKPRTVYMVTTRIKWTKVWNKDGNGGATTASKTRQINDRQPPMMAVRSRGGFLGQKARTMTKLIKVRTEGARNITRCHLRIEARDENKNIPRYVDTCKTSTTQKRAFARVLCADFAYGMMISWVCHKLVRSYAIGKSR